MIYATVRAIDTETTALQPPDGGVVEIGYCDVHAMSRGADGKLSNWVVDRGGPRSILVNPGHPITYETSAVHHLTDEDVRKAPKLAEAWEQVEHCDTLVAYAAHYWRFELSFIGHLTGSVPWICTERCAKHQWKGLAAYSNQALRYFRKPKGLDKKKAAPPHRAGPDAYVTAFTLRELLNMGHTVERLVEGTQIVPLLSVCMIGEWRGTPYDKVETGMLEWIVKKPWTSEDDKHTARHVLEVREARKLTGAGGQVF